MVNLALIRSAVEQAAREYPVKRVELFGSYANGSASEKSDVDLLVEFKTSPISLFKISGFQAAVSDLLKLNVDVVTLPLSEINTLFIDKRITLYDVSSAFPCSQ